jgi:hypothetical protein
MRSLGWYIAVGILLVMVITYGFPAGAQSVCGRRADIVKRLNTGFEEQRRAAGLAADGNLVEVFASKSGSWTIIFTRPGGLTCLVAVGDSWQRIEEPLNLTGHLL